jgi:hypothetical protein
MRPLDFRSTSSAESAAALTAAGKPNIDAAAAANGTESPIMRELSSLTQTECGRSYTMQPRVSDVAETTDIG